jgi:tetratricopeptide (TPR) repeat protein
LSAAVVLLVTLTCLALRRKCPALLAAWLTSIIMILPVILIHSGIQIAADRYTYLGCMSWAILAGAVFISVWPALKDSSRAKQRLAAMVPLAVLATLAWLTHVQIGVWRDSVTLWTRAATVQPSVTAHVRLAASLLQDGNDLSAVEQYRKAVALRPNSAATHAYLGRAYLDLQRWDEAASEYRLSLSIARSADAYDGLASAKLMLGDVDEAIRLLQQALRLTPQDAGIRSNLETALAMKRNRDQPQPKLNAPEGR